MAKEHGDFNWSMPDEEVRAFVNDLERPFGTCLYGRRMYEVMKAWETDEILADQPHWRASWSNRLAAHGVAAVNPTSKSETPSVASGYHGPMATAVKKLDLHVGELVEIEGRRYEVVPEKDGPGLTLEPPITPMAELDAMRATKPASAEDFERFVADLPYDDEG